VPPEICPNCGAEVPSEARACPECGSDESTGWSEAAQASRLDLPDETFDYEQFIKEEFERGSPVPRGVHWLWWVAAMVLLAAFVLFWFVR
jgi:hypothetical protein